MNTIPIPAETQKASEVSVWVCARAHALVHVLEQAL